MKRIFLGTALVAMTMLSACENLEIQESEIQGTVVSDVPEDSEAKVIFTATIGPDTKTYLDWDGKVYKTLWEQEDRIYVFDPKTGEREECVLVDGAGTNTARFAGNIEADSYVAIYGNDPYYDSRRGKYEFWFSYYQSCGWWSIWNEDTQSYDYDVRWQRNVFPMVAQSDDKTFSFENLCSVLKLTLTGTPGTRVQYIYIKSNDETIPMYGDAYIDMEGDAPVMKIQNSGEDYNRLECSMYMDLQDKPIEFLAVLPAQTYKGGFTITVETPYGSQDFVVKEDVEMRRSRIRNIDLNVTVEDNNTWGIVGSSPELGEWQYDIPLVKEGDYWVLNGIYLEQGWEFKARANGSWERNLGGDCYGTDSWFSVSQDGPNIIVPMSGVYDITLDVLHQNMMLSAERSWGICGTMTEWGGYYDIEMEYDGNYYIARNVYIDSGHEFVFRANQSWDHIMGFNHDFMDQYYMDAGTPTNTCCPLGSSQYGESYHNLRVIYSGYYDIYLDASNRTAFVMNSDITPDSIPTKDNVLGGYYSNICYNVPDNTLVKVQGLVLAKTNLGFIVALDAYTENAIYVYDKDNLLEHVENGNYLDVYACKTTYRGLPELEYSASNGSWHYIIDPTVEEYYESSTDITGYFSSYSSMAYDYVRFTGTLEKNGTYYNIRVPGSEVLGSIASPVQDIEGFVGKLVCVEGYYLGHSLSNGVSYLNVALKRIEDMSDIPHGSTEDFFPGGDIVVTRRKIELTK